MKKNILILGFIFLLITIALSGCEDFNDMIGVKYEEKNYIVVPVTAEICVNNKTIFKPIPNEPVRIQIIKAGGERLDDVVYTGFDGCTTAHITFNVYKEQVVTAYAYTINDPYNFQKHELPWEVIKATQIDGRYPWKTFFGFFI